MITTLWHRATPLVNRLPQELALIARLPVQRVDIQEEALEVRIRAEGLASLVGELQQPGERKAA